ncbi:MAG: cupin domain-containing protein [Methylobacterium sp.]|uniref:cupin domain-containing protein n=1 Tax=Methylobacterium sp. TaxID=409 RepID=UPI002587A46F|nr:cupin domain-containing protein [Methylobacterium sp.]MBY0295771.1 cupin domain-containing protein [Methylobacterium sp.]
MAEEPTCRVVGAGADYVGKQALTYAPGISAESVGAKAIHLQTVTMPPGARAKAHLHEGHETALHVLSGVAGMWYGPRLEHHLWSRAGDYVHIPAGVPHLPYNASRTEPCTAVIARTDPNEQESVVLRPDLDGLRPAGEDPMA